MSEKTVLDVRGMTCSSCASGISRHLEKMGLHDVNVHFDSGEVEATLPTGWSAERLCKEIDRLGYTSSLKGEDSIPGKWELLTTSLGFRFLISTVFSIPLLLHMVFPWTILHEPLVQFLLCLPVMLIGWQHFGRSALGAIRSGTSNMDVLISLGSGSAFIYSCIEWSMMHKDAAPPHLYFETAATIITLLLLGNLIERRSLKSTQAGLEALVKIQPDKAQRIIDPMTDRERTETIDTSLLRTNDLVLIPTGNRIPADGLVYEGSADIDTSLMTGESVLRSVVVNDTVLSGTVVSDGYLKIIVQHAGNETALSRMIDTVRNSALRKPAIQRSGDRLSAVFVPVVIGLAIITFCLNFWWMNHDAGQSLLRAVAVLVISCPCAMGLATPTAVSVGIGKAARQGILVKGGDTLERMSQVRTVVFDKTGTLTEGKMSIDHVHYSEGADQSINGLIGTLEQYSTHPYASALTTAYGNLPLSADIRFRDIREVKGKGVEATTTDDRCYRIGSAVFAGGPDADPAYQVFLSCDGKRLASIRFSDTIRKEAAHSIGQIKALGLNVVMLSGDRLKHCIDIAKRTGITEVYGEKLPEEKAEIIRSLQEKGPVAMVGDGINDSAAMAIADVGIAMGKGTSIAIKTAEAVLMNNQPLNSIAVLRLLSIDTLRTIRQNLGWALAYNLVAIPMAATGMLSPLLASLSMAFSDVVVIGNSLRLHLRKNRGDS